MCRTSMTTPPRSRTSHANALTLSTASALGFVAIAMFSGAAVAQRPAAPSAPPSPGVPAGAPRAPQTIPGASGWVGITTRQSGQGDSPDDVHVGYPVIVSVDPGSPAQVAGLVAGDTVLSYNDVNAQDDMFAVQRFLRPGQRIVVHVRRDGERDVALTVAKRPSRSHLRMSVRTDEVAMIPSAPMAQLGPIAIAAPLRIMREAPLAGAQLAEMNAGLANVLNVRDQGVLVVDVLPGSPALSSGLVPGDVIVRADSLVVTSPIAIIRAMRMASDRSVILALLRKGKTQKVTLRW